MKDLGNQPKSRLEVKFEREHARVVVSGTDVEILDVLKKILEVKQTDSVRRISEVKTFLDGLGDFEPEFTFGTIERVLVRKDRFGVYGKRNNAILLYFPNNPTDQNEEEMAVSRIKETMKKIGYDI